MIAIRLLVDGAVVRETVFTSDTVVIGRGPESDFVIVDPSVSRQHARIHIDETGSRWIEDAGSRNGLRVAARRADRATIPATGALRCHLGMAEIEVAVSSLEETAEIMVPDLGAHGPLYALKALALWAAAVTAWVGLVLIEPSFWSPWNQDSLTTLSRGALGVAVGLPILAFVLIGLLRIVGRRVRVGDALRSLAAVIWGWVLLTLLDEATSYGLTVWAHGVVSALLRQGGVVVTFAYLASVGRPGPRWRFFLVWAAAIAVMLVGFGAAGRLAVRQMGTPQVDYDVKVPIAGVTGPATDLDSFLTAVRADFSTAADHAEEEHRRSNASR